MTTQNWYVRCNICGQDDLFVYPVSVNKFVERHQQCVWAAGLVSDEPQECLDDLGGEGGD